METLSILLNKGIGPFSLGLSQTEVELLIKELHRNLDSKQPMRPSRIERCASSKCYTVRYYIGSPLMLIDAGYNQNERLVSISIDRSTLDFFETLLNNKNVFSTEAEMLVNELKHSDNCTFDQPDEQLSTQYTFLTLGIHFWREYAFHRKLLEDSVWMKTMSDVLEDEYQHLYFDMVTVFDPHYAKEFGYI